MRKAAILLGLAGWVLASCGPATRVGSTGEGCAGLEIVVTTSVLGDVVASVAGDQGQVEVLMPLGADPHSFQVSAGQAVMMRRADLLVVNGLGLEGTLEDAIRGAEEDGVPVVEAGSFVEALPFGEGGGGGELDPHIWTDPRRMADVVTGLGEALAAADPSCPERWQEAAADYRAELLRLDEEIEVILQVIPAERRKLVTNHHSLGYFADRYGFEVLGSIIPGGSTLAEPSPADLASLAGLLEQQGVRVVFAETTRPADLADALAAELGEEVTVVALYTGSLGEPGSGAETYPAMQRTNAERIAAALGGS
jgi:zinc/manganese transport system substrate-binding protein